MGLASNKGSGKGVGVGVDGRGVGAENRGVGVEYLTKRGQPGGRKRSETECKRDNELGSRHAESPR